MKLSGSDPDLETIYNRIKKKVFNLQPDFQRGEVWSPIKKKCLIDSILRGWHIPPIHIVENKQEKSLEVLDGQQRLSAIRDFIEGKFPIDGSIEPDEKQIRNLDGLFYQDLPPETKLKFDGYTIRIFTVTDYRADEPAELFYRLNQPTNLTSAEKRNAFYGPVRDQVKEIKNLMDELGFERDFLGFSNARMAYEDVISKVFYATEIGTLGEAISSTMIAKRFREPRPIEGNLFNKVKKSIELFAILQEDFTNDVKFNKATFFSWIIFLVQNANTIKKTPSFKESFSDFVKTFESLRADVKAGRRINNKKFNKIPEHVLISMFEVFNDRAGSRVADVSSVKLRDIIIWLLAYHHAFNSELHLKALLTNNLKAITREIINEKSTSLIEKKLLESIQEFNWDSVII